MVLRFAGPSRRHGMSNTSTSSPASVKTASAPPAPISMPKIVIVGRLASRVRFGRLAPATVSWVPPPSAASAGSLPMTSGALDAGGRSFCWEPASGIDP
jgi:hypothetical protein